MALRVVLVLLSTFCLGEGYSRIEAVSYLKTEAESSRGLALFVKNIFSETALNYIYFLKERESLEDLNEIDSEAHCGKIEEISAVFSDFTEGVKRISQPLNFWISEMSHHIEKIDLYLDRSKKTEDTILTLPHSVHWYQRPLPDFFIGECHVPTQKPGIGLDSNDIYSYQERIEGCGTGSLERYQCGSGECIDSNRTCDGIVDCWDGSDELGLCHDDTLCKECPGVCVLSPMGPRCTATCPQGFEHSVKVCTRFQTCHRLCQRGIRTKPISTRCLVEILPNLVDTIGENSEKLRNLTYQGFVKVVDEIRSCKNENVGTFNVMASAGRRNPTWHTTTRHPTWHTTTRHPTWHPTTRHTTWHPTTRHPTWHPTTRHTTWHPTTRHPTWHPTTRHTTWHPTWHTTTRHPTWHTTTRHPTWHTTTRHPTWHTTTRHPTWHTTTRHPTWHTTTRHSTWHTTTRHPTWHTTTRHPTRHTTTRHPTWHTTTRHPTWHTTTRHPTWHTTTRHPTWHTTTRHPTWPPTTRHTTWHPTTRHTTWDTTTENTKQPQPTGHMIDQPTTWPTISRTTKHHTTKHTTHHTTKHTTHHTTAHTTHHTTKHTTPHTSPTTTATPHTSPTTTATPHTSPTTTATPHTSPTTTATTHTTPTTTKK